MQFKIRYSLIIIGLLSFIIEGLQAQNGAASAYTSFGVGRIESGATIQYEAMGGTGIALPSEYSINTLNPASLAGLKSEGIIFDLGLRTSFTEYSHDTESGSAFTGGLNNLTLAFKPGEKWVTSFNVSQFSSLAYKINSETYIDGSTTLIDKNYEGSGGLSEVSVSNAYAVNSNLSLGLTLSYVFGKLNKQESYSSSVIGGDLTVDYGDFLQQMTVGAGIQYKLPLKKSNLLFGATYNPAVNFNTEREVQTSSSSGAGIIEEMEEDDYKIPANLGGGVAWMNNHGIKIALDYRYQSWSNINYSSPIAEYKDSHKFNGGVEYRRRKSRKLNPYLWRLGGYYEDSYIQVKGKTIMDRGITAGVGIPLRGQSSYLNVSFNYGSRGTNNNALITENYYGISVSMSMVESWFKKRTFD
ncbi:OmpP1/FadL family transporter [Labilibacter marinus]|uniref:OmpP1/FadL family transporter n=1 Tax=Labilibacter marinus TaxID=1477105 RepID=UPI00082D1556|nr:hypothetical protein [Labilibacter marinus]